MRFGFELPPQQRVHGGFFIHSFCMGNPLVIVSLVFAGALGAKPLRHEVE